MRYYRYWTSDNSCGTAESTMNWRYNTNWELPSPPIKLTKKGKVLLRRERGEHPKAKVGKMIWI